MDLSAWCLALAMYNEARGEPRQGQIAVAQVILTRSEKRKLDICGVIYEPGQFQNMTTTKVRDHAVFARLHQMAKSFIIKPIVGPVAKADHFHAVWITPPSWTKSMNKVATIGQHVFYEPKHIPRRKVQKVPERVVVAAFVY